MNCKPIFCEHQHEQCFQCEFRYKSACFILGSLFTCIKGSVLFKSGPYRRPIFPRKFCTSGLFFNGFLTILLLPGLRWVVGIYSMGDSLSWNSSSYRPAFFQCLLGATNDGVTRDLLTSIGSTSMMQTPISQWTNKYVRKIRPEAALCVWAAGRRLFFVICEKLSATRAKLPRYIALIMKGVSLIKRNQDIPGKLINARCNRRMLDSSHRWFVVR